MKNTFNNIKQALAGIQLSTVQSNQAGKNKNADTHLNKIKEGKSINDDHDDYRGASRGRGMGQGDFWKDGGQQQEINKYMVDIQQAKQRLTKYEQLIQQQKQKRQLLEQLLQQASSSQQSQISSSSQRQEETIAIKNKSQYDEKSQNQESMLSSEQIYNQFAAINQYMGQFYTNSRQQEAKPEFKDSKNKQQNQKVKRFVNTTLGYQNNGKNFQRSYYNSRTKRDYFPQYYDFSIFQGKKQGRNQQNIKNTTLSFYGFKNKQKPTRTTKIFKKLEQQKNILENDEDLDMTNTININNKQLQMQKQNIRRNLIKQKVIQEQKQKIRDENYNKVKNIDRKYRDFIKIKQKYEKMDQQNNKNILRGNSASFYDQHTVQRQNKVQNSLIHNLKPRKNFNNQQMKRLNNKNNLNKQFNSQYLSNFQQKQKESGQKYLQLWIVEPYNKRHEYCRQTLRNQDRKYYNSLRKTKKQFQKCNKLIRYIKQLQVYQKLK